MITIKKVNKELAKKFDGQLELVKGDGYFYFAGVLANQMRQQGLYGTNNISAYTIEEIIKIAESRIQE